MKIFGETDAMLRNKWKPVLEAADDTMAPIDMKNEDLSMGMARMLENTSSFLASQRSMFGEATPTSQAAGVSGYDDIILQLARRVGPQILGNNLVGVQPLNGPTGKAFAMVPRFGTQAGPDMALAGIKGYFGGATSAGLDGTLANEVPGDIATDPFAAGYSTGTGAATAMGEGDVTSELSLTIDEVTVGVKTHRMKASWSAEMMQDMANQHKIDAGSVFASLMSETISSEINYNLLRTIYITAVLGATDTLVPGEYNMGAGGDTDGRWIGETAKVLAMRIAEEASQIFKDTRVGAGTFVVVDSRLYNALYNAGLITPNSAGGSLIDGDGPIVKDPSVKRGVLNGNLTVYVDQMVQMPARESFFVVGYKGNSAAEAGIIHCPYVPVWMTPATDTASGQPILFAKTRYGNVSNPLAGDNGAFTPRSNPFYRIVKVTNVKF